MVLSVLGIQCKACHHRGSGFKQVFHPPTEAVSFRTAEKKLMSGKCLQRFPLLTECPGPIGIHSSVKKVRRKGNLLFLQRVIPLCHRLHNAFTILSQFFLLPGGIAEKHRIFQSVFCSPSVNIDTARQDLQLIHGQVQQSVTGRITKQIFRQLLG